MQISEKMSMGILDVASRPWYETVPVQQEKPSFAQFASLQPVVSDDWNPTSELEEEDNGSRCSALMQWAQSDEETSYEELPSRRAPQGGRYSRAQLATEAYGVIQDVIAGRVPADALDAVAGIAVQPQGGEAVTDALETTVTEAGGATKMTTLFHKSAASTRATRALSLSLSQSAAATPVRTIGVLLLTTDHQGGQESIGSFFQAASHDAGASTNMAAFLGNASSSQDGCKGLVELLDTLSQPGADGGRESADAVACLLARASRQGAYDVARCLANLQDAEGGARCTADLMHRFTATRTGRIAARHMLFGLSRDNADVTARLLARAASSQRGASCVVSSLQRMADSPRAQQTVSGILDRVDASRSGRNFWAAAQRNAGNALQQLLDQVYGAASQPIAA